MAEGKTDCATNWCKNRLNFCSCLALQFTLFYESTPPARARDEPIMIQISNVPPKAKSELLQSYLCSPLLNEEGETSRPGIQSKIRGVLYREVYDKRGSNLEHGVTLNIGDKNLR